MNEPNNMPTPQTWRNAAQAAVNAIRTVDMSTPIVVVGDEWASAQYWQVYNANLKITDPAKDIIYEAHSYFDNGSGLYSRSYAQQGDTPQTGVQDVAPFLQWLKTNGYRGFVGELGVPSNDPQWIPLLNNVFERPSSQWSINNSLELRNARFISSVVGLEDREYVTSKFEYCARQGGSLIHSLNGAAADPAPTVANITAGGTNFNNDSYSDILWQNTGGQASIWEMNGTNILGEANVGANPGPSWKAIGTGDFNDDGHSDILWQNTSGQASRTKVGFFVLNQLRPFPLQYKLPFRFDTIPSRPVSEVLANTTTPSPTSASLNRILSLPAISRASAYRHASVGAWRKSSPSIPKGQRPREARATPRLVMSAPKLSRPARLICLTICYLPSRS
jgi:hypothetical protein